MDKYDRSESDLTDHRPVFATFEVPVKKVLPDRHHKCRLAAEDIARRNCEDTLRRVKID
ncbi:hypothetical protein HK405_002329, partial [Cladochytrium tenue]